MIETQRRSPDYPLLALVAVLTVFGLVMVYSASFFIAVNEGQAQTYYLLRQLLWVVIGSVGLLAGMRIDYRTWRKWALPLLLVSIGLLLLVLALPDSLSSGGGANRWIRIPGVGQFQPTEIAKFSLTAYLSAWLISRGDDKLKSMSKGLIPFGVVVGVFCGIMYFQANVSSAFMLTLIASSIYFAAGANLMHIGIGIVGAGGVGWIFVTTLGHASQRLQIFRDPWSDPLGVGFQPIHSLYALASGSWFGRGLGQGRQKFLWLPSAHSDAIFGVIGEELGLVGAGLVVAAFLLLAFRGYRIAARSRDSFAALMAVGITSWITFQAFLNMAVVSSLIPYTGQTLPFISYGGTSLAMCMFAMGVLLNISKHVDDQRVEPVVSPAVERRSSEPRKRRAIGLVPVFTALMRRRDRGPRVSGTHRRWGFTRTAKRSAVSVDARGWRRLSEAAKPAKPAKRKRSAPTQSGGTWRSH